MNLSLKQEIINYLRAARMSSSKTKEETTNLPLSQLYPENDLVKTPGGEYYSKQEVFAFLKRNGYELNQMNFDMAIPHCLIPISMIKDGVPYREVVHRTVTDELESISDDDLNTYLLYSLLQNRTQPVTIFEYKVITLKDSFFLGKTKSKEIQDLLNDHASKGWRLKTATTNDYTNLVGSGDRDEIILIFERPKPHLHSND